MDLNPNSPEPADPDTGKCDRAAGGPVWEVRHRSSGPLRLPHAVTTERGG